MSNCYCCVCASNEGVFLDVAGNTGDTIQHHLQTCLSVKITKQLLLSNKVCHKCVYELNQCNNFVEACKKRSVISGKNYKWTKPCCNLCRQRSVEGCLFDLSKDNHSQDDIFHNICKIFKDYPICDKSSILICLKCRYTLDLLADLRNISKDSEIKLKKLIEESADYLTLPKTKTFVVTRKTTEKILSASDLGTSTMAQGNTCDKKSKRKRSASTSKTRICDECENPVEDGADMYRFHNTGLTVCKPCWVTVDIGKMQSLKQTDKVNMSIKNTKRCSVFLKDVLKSKALRMKQSPRVINNSKGNKTYINSDESFEDEEKRWNKTTSHSVSSDENSHATDETEPRSLRRRKTSNQTGDYMDNDEKKSSISEPSLHVINNVKETHKRKLDKTEPSKVTSRNSAKKSVQISLNPDTFVTPSSKNTKQRKRHSDISDSEFESIAKRIKSETVRSSRNSNTEESSSCEEIVRKNTKVNKLLNARYPKNTLAIRKRGNMRPKCFSTSDVSSKFKKHSTKRVRFYQNRQKNIRTIVINENDFPKIQEYSCNECGATYGNKLLGLTHELTHYKHLQLKLQKVEIPPHKEEKESVTESVQTLTDNSEQQQSAKEDSPDHQHNEESEKDLTALVSKVAEEDGNTNLETAQSQETSSNDKDTKNEDIEMADGKTTESVEEESTIAKPVVDVHEETVNVDILNAETEDKLDEPACQETVSKEESKLSVLEDDKSVPETTLQNEVEENIVQSAEESGVNESPNAEKDDKDILNEAVTDMVATNTADVDLSSKDDTSKTIVDESTANNQDENDGTNCDTECSVEADTKSEHISIPNETIDNETRKILEEEENDDTLQLKADDENSLNEVVEKENEEKNTETVPEEEDVNKELEEDLNKELEEELCGTEPSENLQAQHVQGENHLNNSAADVADVLREVFDLASSEIEKRFDAVDPQTEKEVESVEETLENISLELYNGGNMPPLESVNASNITKKDECMQ